MRKGLPYLAVLVALSVLVSGCIIINVEKKGEEKKKPEEGAAPTAEVQQEAE